MKKSVASLTHVLSPLASPLKKLAPSLECASEKKIKIGQ